MYTDNILFSGDTLIHGKKTITKIVDGDKMKLCESLGYLKMLFKQNNPIVYSRHGTKFIFNDYFVNPVK